MCNSCLKALMALWDTKCFPEHCKVMKFEQKTFVVRYVTTCIQFFPTLYDPFPHSCSNMQQNTTVLFHRKIILQLFKVVPFFSVNDTRFVGRRVILNTFFACFTLSMYVFVSKTVVGGVAVMTPILPILLPKRKTRKPSTQSCGHKYKTKA